MDARQICLMQLDAVISSLTEQLTVISELRRQVAETQEPLKGVLIEQTLRIGGVEVDASRVGPQDTDRSASVIRSAFAFDGEPPVPARKSALWTPPTDFTAKKIA